MMDRLKSASVAVLLASFVLPGCFEASRWEFTEVTAQTVGRVFDGRDAEGNRIEREKWRLLYDSRHRVDLGLNGDRSWEATLGHRDDSPAPVPLLASMIGGSWTLADGSLQSGKIESELFLSEPAVLAATAEMQDAAETALSVRIGDDVELSLTMVRHDLEALAAKVAAAEGPPRETATFVGRVVYAGMAKVPSEGGRDFPVRITTRFTGTGQLSSQVSE